MARKNKKDTHCADWAAATGMSAVDVKAAWEELRRRGLVSARRGHVTISPLAMRRATSETQRRLTAYLSGYVLTENSFIVHRAGDPPGSPCILNTRITVEQIANYFRAGWG
jgi:DNA-binding transcriptional MocR family regulator